jgi:hypothetical protein
MERRLQGGVEAVAPGGCRQLADLPPGEAVDRVLGEFLAGEDVAAEPKGGRPGQRVLWRRCEENGDSHDST